MTQFFNEYAFVIMVGFVLSCTLGTAGYLMHLDKLETAQKKRKKKKKR